MKQSGGKKMGSDTEPAARRAERCRRDRNLGGRPAGHRRDGPPHAPVSSQPAPLILSHYERVRGTDYIMRDGPPHAPVTPAERERC
jgi:hypothetical protein